MSQVPEDAEFPLDANGPAYTRREERHGVPLTYVAEKLNSAIVELHRYAGSRPAERKDLAAAMHYLLVAHLGLNNMLGAAGDHDLAERLLAGSSEDLHSWLHVIARGGDVRGLAELGGPDR